MIRVAIVEDNEVKRARIRECLCCLEEIEEIQSAMRICAGQFKTGSEILDVLFTANIHCEEAGITLSCTGQGSDLSFTAPMDLYSLFGNAISNAADERTAITAWRISMDRPWPSAIRSTARFMPPPTRFPSSG